MVCEACVHRNLDEVIFNVIHMQISGEADRIATSDIAARLRVYVITDDDRVHRE